MDADRPLRCGLTMSEPEMQLGLRDHRCPNPVSWFPGRDGRSAKPSPVLPAGGQPVMVTIGRSVSLSAAGWRRKALLKPMPNCLPSAVPLWLIQVAHQNSDAISRGILWLVTLVSPLLSWVSLGVPCYGLSMLV